MNEMELLESVDKITRRQHPHLRIDPAHECFITAYLSGLYTNDRLIEYLDVFILYGFIDMIDDILLLAELITQHLVIYAVVYIVPALDTVTCKSCMIARKPHFGKPVVKIVYSGLDPDLFVGIFGHQDLPLHRFDSGDHLILRNRGTDYKMIIGKTCDRRLIAECLAKYPGKIA